MASRQTLPVFKKHSLVCFWKIPTTGVGPLFTVVSGSLLDMWMQAPGYSFINN